MRRSFRTTTSISSTPHFGFHCQYPKRTHRLRGTHSGCIVPIISLPLAPLVPKESFGFKPFFASLPCGQFRPRLPPSEHTQQLQIRGAESTGAPRTATFFAHSPCASMADGLSSCREFAQRGGVCYLFSQRALCAEGTQLRNAAARSSTPLATNLIRKPHHLRRNGCGVCHGVHPPLTHPFPGPFPGPVSPPPRTSGPCSLMGQGGCRRVVLARKSCSPGQSLRIRPGLLSCLGRVWLPPASL